MLMHTQSYHIKLTDSPEGVWMPGLFAQGSALLTVLFIYDVYNLVITSG